MDAYTKESTEDQADDSQTSLLQGHTDEEECPLQPTAKPPARSKMLAVILAAFLIGLATTAIPGYIVSQKASCPANSPTTEHDLATQREPLHCGSSPSDARSLGCKLQTWSYSWVPEPCFDADLNEQFIAVHEKEELPYYLEPNGTQAVDFDTVYHGDIPVLYTAWGSHFWHCAFLMRKFFRQHALFTVAQFDYKHAQHCQMWMANPFQYDWKRINTKAVLVYATCDADGYLSMGDFETIGQ